MHGNNLLTSFLKEGLNKVCWFYRFTNKGRRERRHYYIEIKLISLHIKLVDKQKMCFLISTIGH